MTNSCSITFNTKDNKETHRYEVWCLDFECIKRFICWVDNIDNIDHITGVIKAMGGSDIEFIDTDPDKVWGKTGPIGGEE